MERCWSLHSDGVLEKVIPMQELHTTEDILRQKQAVYEINFWLRNRNTPLAECAGNCLASVLLSWGDLYCWTDVLGVLCSWQWNSPFPCYYILMLQSRVAAYKLPAGRSPWSVPAHWLNLELFCIKMVICNQNLCQGLWDQAPRVGGWVLVPSQSIPWHCCKLLLQTELWLLCCQVQVLLLFWILSVTH